MGNQVAILKVNSLKYLTGLLVTDRYVDDQDEVNKYPVRAVLEVQICLYCLPTQNRNSTPTTHSATPNLDPSVITLPNPRPDLQTRYILQHPTRNSIQDRPSTPTSSVPSFVDIAQYHRIPLFDSYLPYTLITNRIGMAKL